MRDLNFCADTELPNANCFQCVLNMEVTKQMSRKIIDASKMLKSRADNNAFDSSDACVIDGICKALTAFAYDLLNRAKSFDLPVLPEVVEDEEGIPMIEIMAAASSSRNKAEGLADAVEQLLGILKWSAGRLRTMDICLRQLEVANEISKAVGTKEHDYYKVGANLGVTRKKDLLVTDNWIERVRRNISDIPPTATQPSATFPSGH